MDLRSNTRKVCRHDVIGRGHRMMMLERLIQRLMESGAVFMTMEAAMEEWRRKEARDMF